MRDDNRGVSDLLGFVMIFGIMIVSVGLIAVVGFGTVGSVGEGEQLASAEVSMTELADQMAGIADHEAPVRSTEARIHGATIRMINGPTMTIEANRTVGDDWNDTVELGGVEYRLGDRAITVAGGSVIRTDGDSSVMLREPPFFGGNDRLRLNLLRVEEMAIDAPLQASSTVQIRTHHHRTQLLEPTNRSHLTDVESLSIEIGGDDPVAAAWRSYLESSESWTADGHNRWTATNIDEGVVLRLTILQVQFIR